MERFVRKSALVSTAITWKRIRKGLWKRETLGKIDYVQAKSSAIVENRIVKKNIVSVLIRGSLAEFTVIVSNVTTWSRTHRMRKNRRRVDKYIK